ncbi:metallophosphoesterase [Rhodovulum sp. 12E13]|uniref:metallophosphoesterase family protein n=1 Tax=Rhodovulum sp. 12E13 TaxID=2203891 RepID=UPI000E1317FC|nr:metallophosphoesterase family protein [Rhodovulum sp. 12E13]RDC69713.1 metallophosphoesterase [Rhodovulum sp. 12E13]
MIPDTHGLLRPEALERLAGVEHILHAGDIGRAGIVERLAEVAPVTAIRGNVDTADRARVHPERVTVELSGHVVLMVHDRKALGAGGVPGGVSIVVSGQSHKPSAGAESGVLSLDPGSAGPRRFPLPVTLGGLDLGQAVPSARIVELIRTD